ncbi:MAG: N-acetylglucosamine-6-phosphate deacetylase, partial [bacterium]
MGGRLVLAAGVVVAPDRDLVPGYVVVEGELIVEVAEGTPRGADREFPHGVLAPGFVDVQVNGAAGADFLSCTPEQYSAARRYLASTGTTSFVPTLITAPPEVVRAAAQVVASGAGGGAQPVGVHLEGPAISPNRAGAHDPRWIVPPGDPRVRQLVADLGGLVRVVTLAPEQPGGLELVRWLAAAGVV